jgi:hypothetical protein
MENLRKLDAEQTERNEHSLQKQLLEFDAIKKAHDNIKSDLENINLTEKYKNHDDSFKKTNN